MHTLFEGFVNNTFVVCGEFGVVHRFGVDTVGYVVEVAEHTLAEEGCDGCHQAGEGLQTGVERLVGRNLVFGVFAFPETAATQTHVPVAEVPVDELLNGAASFHRLVVVEIVVYGFHKGVELGEYPAVDFGTAGDFDVGLGVGETVDICVKREETVGVVQCAEEFLTHIVNAGGVEFQGVPRLRVGNHVPTCGVGSEFLYRFERIHSVAQTFGHFLSFAVEHQAVGNHVFIRHRVEAHRGDGVEGEEPTAGLVHTFGDKVGGESLGVELTFLAHVMNLCVRHCAAVEPHVDKVGFAEHFFAFWRNQHYAVDVGTVQVEFLVIGGGVGVIFHKSRLDGFVYLGTEFGHAADAYLLGAVLGAPDGQRCAPITRARQVPIHQIFEPVAETSAAGGLGFPVDSLVKLYHSVFQCGGANKPTVEGVVEHGLVGTPAVGVAVGVFLAAEELAFGLEHHHNLHIEGGVFLGLFGVVGVFHEFACIGCVKLGVDASFHKLGVELLDEEELAGAVHHGLLFAVLVEKHEGRHAGLFGHAVVVGTESGCYVHYAGTVFGGDVVAEDDAESAFTGVHPRDELFVFQILEFLAFDGVAENAERHFLVAHLVFLEGDVCIFGGEHAVKQRLSHNNVDGCAAVGVEGVHQHVFDAGTYGEGSVRRQCPRGGGPCQYVHIFRFDIHAKRQCLIGFEMEHRHAGGVLHIAVAAWHVELVRAEARASGGTEGLDGVAFVQQTFVIQVFKQEPQGFDIFVFESDIRVVEVHPIAHLTGEFVPEVLVFHHLFAAGAVVVVHADFLADVLLGDAEFFLHAEFHGQTVGVPAGFAVHKETLHSFVAAENIFYATCHNVVNARHSVCRRRTFVEYERRFSFGEFETFVEGVVFFPVTADFLAKTGHV